MSTTKRMKRKDKRNVESPTVSGTGGSHLSSDSETPHGNNKNLRKSGRLIMKKKLGKAMSVEQAYEGDKENSSESSPSSISPPHTDEYEFDDFDVIPVDKSSKKQNMVKKNKILQKKTTEKNSSKPLRIASKNPDLKKTRVLSSTSIHSEVIVLADNKKIQGGRLKRKITDTTGDSNQKKRIKKPVISHIFGTPMTDSSTDKTDGVAAIVDNKKPLGVRLKRNMADSSSDQKKRVKKSFITPVVGTAMTDSSTDKTDNIPPAYRRSKRKISDSINITPAVPRGYDKSIFEMESDRGDSGMFISPPPWKCLRLSAKDTSTPSDTSKPDLSSSRDVKMGFDETVSLLFSPVEKVYTPSPTSDYGSIVSSMSQFSIVETEIPQPIFEPELKLNKSINKGYKNGSKIKIKKSKSRYSVSKVEAWADKVNEDFDEIEKFELSIEG